MHLADFRFFFILHVLVELTADGCVDACLQQPNRTSRNTLVAMARGKSPKSSSCPGSGSLNMKMPWMLVMLYRVSFFSGFIPLGFCVNKKLTCLSSLSCVSCSMQRRRRPGFQVLTLIDGSDFKGERLTVQFARGPRRKETFSGPMDRPSMPRPRRTMFRMLVSGLPETSWQVSSPQSLSLGPTPPGFSGSIFTLLHGSSRLIPTHPGFGLASG